MLERVTEIQSQTGVKDKTAQFWIEKLIEKSRDLQRRRITDATSQDRDERLQHRMSREERQQLVVQIKDEIQEECLEWLYTQPAHSYCNIPAESCASSSMFIIILILVEYSFTHLGHAVRHRDSGLRRTLRPGDHYNALLNLPGLFFILKLKRHTGGG